MQPTLGNASRLAARGLARAAAAAARLTAFAAEVAAHSSLKGGRVKTIRIRAGFIQSKRTVRSVKDTVRVDRVITGGRCVS